MRAGLAWESRCAFELHKSKCRKSRKPALLSATSCEAGWLGLLVWPDRCADPPRVGSRRPSAGDIGPCRRDVARVRGSPRCALRVLRSGRSDSDPRARRTPSVSTWRIETICIAGRSVDHHFGGVQARATCCTNRTRRGIRVKERNLGCRLVTSIQTDSSQKLHCWVHSDRWTHGPIHRLHTLICASATWLTKFPAGSVAIRVTGISISGDPVPGGNADPVTTTNLATSGAVAKNKAQLYQICPPGRAEGPSADSEVVECSWTTSSQS